MKDELQAKRGRIDAAEERIQKLENQAAEFTNFFNYFFEETTRLSELAEENAAQREVISERALTESISMQKKIDLILKVLHYHGFIKKEQARCIEKRVEAKTKEIEKRFYELDFNLEKDDE
jgi:ribosomal protein L16 Arg81 hydroxylase